MLWPNFARFRCWGFLLRDVRAPADCLAGVLSAGRAAPFAAAPSAADPALDKAARIYAASALRRMTQIGSRSTAGGCGRGAFHLHDGKRACRAQIFPLQYEGHSTSAAAMLILAPAAVALAVMIAYPLGRGHFLERRPRILSKQRHGVSRQRIDSNQPPASRRLLRLPRNPHSGRSRLPRWFRSPGRGCRSRNRGILARIRG